MACGLDSQKLTLPTHLQHQRPATNRTDRTHSAHSKTKPMKTSILLLATIALFAPSLPIATKAATQVYDLNADWSDTQNPNGPWSFRDGEGGLFVNTPFPWVNSGYPVPPDVITKITAASVSAGIRGFSR